MQSNPGQEWPSAVLAFDTSAYTTSVAAVREDGSVLAEERRLLDVKKGDRGLRQSQAFFQHMANLPGLTSAVCHQLKEQGTEICAVSASSKPRPEEGSYMPVFMAGLRTAECVASALRVPIYRFSHQEGHIAAVAGVLPQAQKSLAFHLSGGTSELLLLEGCTPVRITGGSKDLSFGQLIDRTGVAYGMYFPAGKRMDEAALEGMAEVPYHFSSRKRRVFEEPLLGPIYHNGTSVNLSGTETLCQKAARQELPLTKVAAELFFRIADVIVALVSEAARQEQVVQVILAGGVASSRFLRGQIRPALERRGLEVFFGDPALSSDYAVGTARLGMDAYLRDCATKNQQYRNG